MPAARAWCDAGGSQSLSRAGVLPSAWRGAAWRGVAMSPIAPLLVGLDAEVLPDGVVVVEDIHCEDDGQEEREAADAAGARSGEGV